jgi:ribA/ribD-fused uncharacterized protein
MSISLSSFLAHNVAGQKRTGQKQFVFFADDVVYKGPYPAKSPRFENVIFRSDIFTAWGTPCVVKPLDVIETPDGPFIRFPNIMAGYPIESETYTEPKTGLTYEVRINAPILDVLHALPANPWITAEASDLILALIHCNILGVGDMNLRNSLVNPATREFFVIDYDDNLGTDRDDATFYFNKSPAKALRWAERVAPLYAEVADRLEPLRTDPLVAQYELLDRVERAINLLRQYATLATPAPEPKPSTRRPKASPAVAKSPAKASKDPTGIYFFEKGPYFELSNYWMKKDGTTLLVIDEIEFKSSEHAFQFYKFYYPEASPETLAYAELIRNAATPNDARLLAGQKVKGGFQSRMNAPIKAYQDRAHINPAWDQIRVDLMRTVLYYKFTQNPHCQDILLGTDNRALYENSPYDAFWGVGKDQTGSNWLGRLLVELRDRLREESAPGELPQPHPIGQMVWKGIRGGATKTYSGIDFDVAKSAMQKYIRRRMTQKAILAGIELYRLGEVGGGPAVTNTFNRIGIIANEDVGVANLPLVLAITQMVESGTRDLAALVAMIQLLAESPKTRLMSHAWRTYAHPEGRAVARELGVALDTEFSATDRDYIETYQNDPIFLESDPVELRDYILIFRRRLEARDLNAFTWAYFFLEAMGQDKVGKRNKYLDGAHRGTTTHPTILLWQVLGQILPPAVHDILVEAYYNHAENRPFLQHAILIAIYNLGYESFDLTPYIEFWRVQPVLTQMVEGQFTLEVDPFVIDKHTAAGRRSGMTERDFVIEGSIVIPQDPTYYNELMEQIYQTR